MAEHIINKATGKSLRDAIIDLYLNVKIRSNEEVAASLHQQIAKFDEKTYQAEKSRLDSTDPFIVLAYIQESVEMIMNLRLDSDSGSDSVSASQKSGGASLSDPPRDYEAMLQKLEAETRGHVRTEQLLKLQVESLQFQTEELTQKLAAVTEVPIPKFFISGVGNRTAAGRVGSKTEGR